MISLNYKFSSLKELYIVTNQIINLIDLKELIELFPDKINILNNELRLNINKLENLNSNFYEFITLNSNENRDNCLFSNEDNNLFINYIFTIKTTFEDNILFIVNSHFYFLVQ